MSAKRFHSPNFFAVFRKTVCLKYKLILSSVIDHAIWQTKALNLKSK